MKQKKSNEGLKYLHPGYLRKAVARFGYQFSIKKYIVYFLGLYGCVAALSFAFKLRPAGILTVALAVTGFVPSMFAMVYKNLYEDKRFEDIGAYMEQILYSFKRRAKILNSLEDTLILFEKGTSRLYDRIQEAVHYIQIGKAGENLYREAFAFIEKEYGCKRLYKIHDFLIEAEKAGGDCNAAADILLNDRRLWIDRAYALKREKRNVKVKITIGIGLSFMICAMTVFMLPSEFGITGNAASQIVTVIVILLNMLIWYVAQAKLSKSLIREEEGPKYEEVKRQYDYIMHNDLKREKRKALFLAMLPIPAIVFFAFYKSMAPAALLVILMFLLANLPAHRYRVSLKHVAREVEKVFPEWLLNMSMHLQTDNVHVSLAKSIPGAPWILKDELKILLDRIEKKPDSVRPYLTFMDNVCLPDITCAMKVLYSMAEFGSVNLNGQIGPLAERGALMTDKAERIKTEDFIAGVSFLILLPMITGVAKMLTDLSLVVVYILSAVNHAA